MISATAPFGVLTRAAGISSRPVRNANVTIALARAGFALAGSNEPVGEPAADRLAGAEHEVRQRGVDARSHHRQAAHGHEVVGQPADQEVPVVVEAEECRGRCRAGSGW